MSQINELYEKLINAMGVAGLNIPTTCVKFYTNHDTIPDEILEYHPDNISVTSCQANKQASLGDVILLTKKNIGCIAAAITFGLVDENDENSFQGSRIYTDIMKEQSLLGENFNPPSPKSFTEGIVYACKSSNHQEYCLFGESDTGRYKNAEIARKAIKDMIAIQPPTTQAVFFFTKNFSEINITPDIIVLSVRPVELIRLIQAYQYNTGTRVTASMGSVRVVNSDLIVRPFLTGKINISSYCIGARLIAEYDANRLGMGMPFSIFQDIVIGMEESKGGYPFHLYPGAEE